MPVGAPCLQELHSVYRGFIGASLCRDSCLHVCKGPLSVRITQRQKGYFVSKGLYELLVRQSPLTVQGPFICRGPLSAWAPYLYLFLFVSLLSRIRLCYWQARGMALFLWKIMNTNMCSILQNRVKMSTVIFLNTYVIYRPNQTYSISQKINTSKIREQTSSKQTNCSCLFYIIDNI